MQNRRIYIITGLSGSGKSTAIDAFEDAGYYCIDNMPMELLPKFLELPVKEDPEVKGFAFVMDMRSKNFLAKYASGLTDLRGQGVIPVTIFLEATEEALFKRYSQTRRLHPVSQDNTLMDSIRKEKDDMLSIKKQSDMVIDTSNYNVHKLKRKILEIIHRNIRDISLIKIQVMSFGFKYGLPREADLVMDVRFLPNPYFEPELRAFDGETASVKQYVLNNDVSKNFLNIYLELLDFLIPQYKKENKSYLTIAVGCTGGRHRSVAISRKIFDHLNVNELKPSITHRDIDKDEKNK